MIRLTAPFSVVSETLSILLSFDKGILPLKYSKMPQKPFVQHTTSKKKVQDVFFIININKYIVINPIYGINSKKQTSKNKNMVEKSAFYS